VRASGRQSGRPDRRDRDDLLGLADRIGELHQIFVELGDAGSDAAAPGEEFLAGSRGKQSGIENVLAALPDFDLARLRVFAQIVADRAVHFLADIGRDELPDAAGADQEVDLETGSRRSDDREIPSPIADDFTHQGHGMILRAETADSDGHSVLDLRGGIADG
jgi:hypothetical protein